MTPLRQRMTEDMRLRNLGPHTQRAYLQYVSQFADHFHKSPEMLGPAEIRAFQLHLSRDRQLSASSVGVAVAALRFLYSASCTRSPSSGAGTSTTSYPPAAGRRGCPSS